MVVLKLRSVGGLNSDAVEEVHRSIGSHILSIIYMFALWTTIHTNILLLATIV